MAVDRCIGSIHGGGRRKQARRKIMKTEKYVEDWMKVLVVVYDGWTWFFARKEPSRRHDVKSE
jgi:hypothetical protein